MINPSNFLLAQEVVVLFDFRLSNGQHVMTDAHIMLEFLQRNKDTSNGRNSKRLDFDSRLRNSRARVVASDISLNYTNF